MSRIKILSSGALRGSIVEQIDKKAFQIQANWPSNGEIFKGYGFRLLHSKEASATVVHCNLYQGILEIDQELPGFDHTEFEISSGEEAPVLAARIATQTPLHEPLPPIDMRLGSTKGTNALLERKGARVAFVTTKGFEDILEIGTQQRPDIFVLNIKKTPPLSAGVFAINERTGADGKVLVPLCEKEVHRLLEALSDFEPEAVAVGLMNSYVEPRHEMQLKEALISAGYPFVSVSHEMAREIKFLPRIQTALVDAWLSPVINNYLGAVASKLPTGTLKVMTSAGGLVDSSLFKPKDSLLSGPAGGVVGAAYVARKHGKSGAITFDMGGTSTDVSRYDGQFSYRFETTVGGTSIFSPAVAIETVAAGGGSVCGFDGSKLTVRARKRRGFPRSGVLWRRRPTNYFRREFIVGAD